jgi:hypothetical protein
VSRFLPWYNRQIPKFRRNVFPPSSV